MTQPTHTPFATLMLLGGRLCLDFCNTVEYHDSEKPIDFLRRGYPAFVYWCKRVAVIDEATVESLLHLNAQQPELVQPVFERVGRLREALHQFFTAQIGQRPLPAEQLDVLNGEIAQAYQARRLEIDPAGKLAWGWRGADPAEAPLLPITLSAVELLTSREVERVRQCPGCGWLFLDQSKNRSRTWCNMRFCGNRSKARQFYQRKKSGKQAE